MTILRNRALALAALLAVVGPATVAHAQSSASVSTSGSATIFQPLAISKTGDLQFGVIVRPLSGTGTVTQPAAGGPRTFTGPLTLLSTAGFPTAQPATFQVQGEGGQSFSIGIPSSFVMNRTLGGGTLTVNLASSVATATLDGALGATGAQTFGVGGTIMGISDTTASGAYTGTFNVTVTYQ